MVRRSPTMAMSHAEKIRRTMLDQEKRGDRAFGLRLLLAIEKRNMSQRELADRLGWNQSMVSRYISGVQLPRIDSLRKIAAAIGTTCADLLGED